MKYAVTMSHYRCSAVKWDGSAEMAAELGIDITLPRTLYGVSTYWLAVPYDHQYVELSGQELLIQDRDYYKLPIEPGDWVLTMGDKSRCVLSPRTFGMLCELRGVYEPES